ncbi:predicted protein [Naegleria gruberi]|uniref:Predicted protein n=1 Tax=Naegleria gruberi TaxID=5762 RepID=D2VPM2_NAEGR|nr:uncharacterized protein NAEGRDRAFT_70913 [Naegleria gruberi]EFC41149.1 predicted protein [Naegleria gruberi]|eukprot:XP_002673893.1 predicted protein [Naegleria gruberi strain NEG-M]
MSQQLISLPASQTKFSSDLFGELLTTLSGNNLVFSPLSIFMALLMTLGGADGETLTVMKKALHIAINNTDIKRWRENTMKGYVKDTMSLVKNNPDMISMANRIFLEQSSMILEDYKSWVENTFEVSVQLSNFVGNSNEERLKINEWVEKQTNNLVKNLLSSSSIDSSTVIVLVNCIYFLGKWKTTFNVSETLSNQVFRTVNGDTNSATLMNMRNKQILYGENSQVKYVNLPYENPGYSMYFVMSSDDATISDSTEKETEKWLSEQLKNNSLKQVLPTLEKKLNHLTIPKFEIEYDISLKDILSKQPFDMSVAFSAHCDLSNMIGNSIQISDVIHKSVIRVSEQGTEAAAATAVIGTRKSKPRIYNFVADRPFIFVIAHEDTILFMGKVNKL